MLSRYGVLAAAALFAAMPGHVAPDAGATVFIPTSEAIHMLETIARADGYDLANPTRYYFDLVQGRDGKPPLAGFVTFNFYWNGDLIETVAINEHSGLAVDTTGCRIFDYPALHRYRAGAAAVAPATLAAQTGCDSFKTIRTPKAPPQHRR